MATTTRGDIKGFADLIDGPLTLTDGDRGALERIAGKLSLVEREALDEVLDVMWHHAKHRGEDEFMAKMERALKARLDTE